MSGAFENRIIRGIIDLAAIALGAIVSAFAIEISCSVHHTRRRCGRYPEL